MRRMKRYRKNTRKLPGLRLARRPGERVRLLVGDVEIWIAIDNCNEDLVRLAFDAPLSVLISREEVIECPE